MHNTQIYKKRKNNIKRSSSNNTFNNFDKISTMKGQMKYKLKHSQNITVSIH